MKNYEYSEYEVTDTAVKIDGETAAEKLKCLSKLEQELEVKNVTKSCRGVVVKKITKGTGNGSLTISLHTPYELEKKLYGQNLKSLIEGGNAYGTSSVHKKFVFTAIATDEEGVEVALAYPNCTLSNGPRKSIENGAEEIAEKEWNIDLMPDEFGQCCYEIPVKNLPDTITKELWLTTFNSSMMQAPTA